MYEFLKLLLSLSLSGAAVTLVLLLLRRLLRNTFSKGWRYYIWLVVFVRLLLPLTLPVNPVGALFISPPPAAVTVAQSPVAQNTAARSAVPESVAAPEHNSPAAPVPQSQIPASVILFAVWGGVALLLLTHKAAQYRRFTRDLRAGSTPVSDPALLERYAKVCAFARVACPPELRTATPITTPMLVGICKPYILLPAPTQEDTLEKVLLHELLHHKRCDVFYKWFAQLVLCLHWFNPVVWLAVRALEQDCELACDECALHLMRPEERRIYGNALLQAVQTEKSCCSRVTSLALGENAKQLKERLGLIMNFRTRTTAEKLSAACLGAALCFGSIAVGAYAAEAPPTPGLIPAKPKSVSSPASQTQQTPRADASTPGGHAGACNAVDQIAGHQRALPLFQQPKTNQVTGAFQQQYSVE